MAFKLKQKIQQIRRYGAQKSGTSIFEGREPKLMSKAEAQARLSHLRPLRSMPMKIRGKFTPPTTGRLVKTTTPREVGISKTFVGKIKRRIQGITRGQAMLRK